MYGKPATRKQHQYLRWLAAKTGTTFTPPRTSLEASAMIEEMQRRKKTGRSELARERLTVSHDMATRRGDAAQVTPRELTGYGSSARWAEPAADEGPRVVHCKRERFDVYIGRVGSCPAEFMGPGSDGCWGNPFKSGRDGTRAEVIEMYECWLLTQPKLLRRLPELRGRELGCWCAPKACHGDVLVRLANGPLSALKLAA
jgi:hypothetical protein